MLCKYVHRSECKIFSEPLPLWSFIGIAYFLRLFSITNVSDIGGYLFLGSSPPQTDVTVLSN